jgi:taurine dioxygenase
MALAQESGVEARSRAAQEISDGLYRTAPLRLRKLTDAFGMEVIGLNEIKGQPAWLGRVLNTLWMEHGLLLFRDLDLGEAEQVALSSLFGEQEIAGRLDINSKAHPELMYLTNRKDLGLPDASTQSNELFWHSDQTYVPRPALGSLLYAVEVPPSGGDTYWADMRTAYDRLPAPTKARIDPLRALHDYTRAMKLYGNTPNEFQKQRSALVEVHPLVRTHPITLRKGLYISPQNTTGVEGMPEAEAAALLAELEACTTVPDLVYRHHWRPGDAVLWDNARVMHRRDGFPADRVRFMRRTTIRPPAELSIPF